MIRPRSHIALLAPALLLLAFGASPAAAAPLDPSRIVYDLGPLGGVDAPLVEAWAAISGADGAPTAAAARDGLAAWLEANATHVRTGVDSSLVRAARWLDARLHALGGREGRAGAIASLRALVAEPWGPFTDLARGTLADLLDRAGDLAGAAEQRLARRPGAPNYLAAARRAVDALERAKRGARAAELLEEALAWSMTSAARLELSLRLASLRWTLGDHDGARRLARELWWRSSHEPTRVEAERLLASWRAPKPARRGARAKADNAALQTPIDAYDRFAHDVLRTSRPDRKLRRKIARTRLRGKARRAAKAWAELVFDRDDADEAAVKRLAKLAPAVKKTPFEPWFLYGQAEVLRKLDLDDEAVESYLEVADRWPDHFAAADALDQASGLLRYLGRPAEAAAVDQRLVARGGHDELHRAALWRVGFDAWLAGNPTGAAATLARLSDLYGGEPDVHSLTWAERADYWRARAKEAAGDRAGAEVLYAHVIARFPASWYALLAADRLGATPVPTYDGPVVARTPWLDTPVTLLRLGAVEEALAELDALFDADYLPGSERALYASLVAERGGDARAKRILRRASVPPVPPAAPPGVLIDAEVASLIASWFPYDFNDELLAAAAEYDLPPALVAGIVHIETRFRADLKSSAGAIGLCQVMPSTGVFLGRRLFGSKFRAKELWNPETNLRIATYLISLLRERYGDRPALIAAAYNAGHGRVNRWLEAHGHLETDAFVELIPITQARRYVKRVLSTAEVYRRLYDLGDTPLPLPRALRPAPTTAPASTPSSTPAAEAP